MYAVMFLRCLEFKTLCFYFECLCAANGSFIVVEEFMSSLHTNARDATRAGSVDAARRLLSNCSDFDTDFMFVKRRFVHNDVVMQSSHAISDSKSRNKTS